MDPLQRAVATSSVRAQLRPCCVIDRLASYAEQAPKLQDVVLAVHQAPNSMRLAGVGAGLGIGSVLSALPQVATYAPQLQAVCKFSGICAVAAQLLLQRYSPQQGDGLANTPHHGLLFCAAVAGVQAGLSLAPLLVVGGTGFAAGALLCAAAAASLVQQSVWLNDVRTLTPTTATIGFGIHMAYAPFAWQLAEHVPIAIAGAAACEALAAAWAFGAIATTLWSLWAALPKTPQADQAQVDPQRVARHRLALPGEIAPSVFNVPDALAGRLAGLSAQRRVDEAGTPYFVGGVRMLALDGPPGSGKSSMALAIGSYFDADVLATSGTQLGAPHVQGISAAHLRLYTLMVQAELRSLRRKRLQVLVVDEIGGMMQDSGRLKTADDWAFLSGGAMFSIVASGLNRGRSGVIVVVADNHMAKLESGMIWLSPRPAIGVPAMPAVTLLQVVADKWATLQTEILQLWAEQTGVALPVQVGPDPHVAALQQRIARCCIDGRTVAHMLERIAGRVRRRMSRNNLSVDGLQALLVQQAQLVLRFVAQEQAEFAAAAPAPVASQSLRNQHLELSNTSSARRMAVMQDLLRNPLALLQSNAVSQARSSTPQQMLQRARLMLPFNEAISSAGVLSQMTMHLQIGSIIDDIDQRSGQNARLVLTNDQAPTFAQRCADHGTDLLFPDQPNALFFFDLVASTAVPALLNVPFTPLLSMLLDRSAAYFRGTSALPPFQALALSLD